MRADRAGGNVASVRINYHLADPAATEALARRFAPALGAGDTLLLAGPIGAGKPHFARALIRARLGREEEVPSPTYTLVQTYDDGATEIWHADLYRLGDAGEVAELGLEEAFSSAICLVEWPELIEGLIPETAVRVTIEYLDQSGPSPGANGRKVLFL